MTFLVKTNVLTKSLENFDVNTAKLNQFRGENKDFKDM